MIYIPRNDMYVIRIDMSMLIVNMYVLREDIIYIYTYLYIYIYLYIFIYIYISAIICFYRQNKYLWHYKLYLDTAILCSFGKYVYRYDIVFVCGLI